MGSTRGKWRGFQQARRRLGWKRRPQQRGQRPKGEEERREVRRMRNDKRKNLAHAHAWGEDETCGKGQDAGDRVRMKNRALRNQKGQRRQDKKPREA